MEEYRIEIELLSESIFGSGESESNGVDVEILKDEIGVPYFKGKTLKGKLREEAEVLKNYFSNLGFGEYETIFSKLFGKEGDYNNETLKFSSCKISKNIHNSLSSGIKENKFTKSDVLNSLTEVRSFTRIDKNGVAKDGSLRQARVIKKGLKLYCEVTSLKDLTSKEKILLASAVAALRNLGTMESRGKGLVKCRLLNGSKDVTVDYINILEKGA